MQEKNLGRIIEALLLASAEPVSVEDIQQAAREQSTDAIYAALEDLKAFYQPRGIQLWGVDGKYQFRTAPDLSEYLTVHRQVKKRLSRAALETLAIVAYHQPVTRVDIEEIRGVTISKGTLDLLLEQGWIQPKGRKQVPGRPLMWGTTSTFLGDFGIESLDALPGLEDLKSAGLLDITDAQLSLKEIVANDDEPEPLEEDAVFQIL